MGNCQNPCYAISLWDAINSVNQIDPTLVRYFSLAIAKQEERQQRAEQKVSHSVAYTVARQRKY
jgi:hypothetical protein